MATWAGQLRLHVAPLQLMKKYCGRATIRYGLGGLLAGGAHWVFLYGKWQWVRYRTAACLAKFLRGHRVRAMWMQFEDEDGKLISHGCSSPPTVS